MNFDEAEARFLSLRARQKGAGPMTQAQFDEEIRELTVQDDRGVWWAIHPETGEWFYHDGNEWVNGTRPASAQSSMTRPDLGSSGTSIHTSPRSRRTGVMPSAAGAGYAGAIGNQQLRSHAGSAAQAGSRSFTWLPLAIGATVLFMCLLLAGVGGGPAWQALTQRPVFTRTALFGWPTSTPVPTMVRVLTPAAPSETAVPVLARVIEARVNVRAAPSLQAQVMTTIAKDQRMTVIARSEDGQWYEAVYQQGAKPGWILIETLQIIEGNTQALPAVRP